MRIVKCGFDTSDTEYVVADIGFSVSSCCGWLPDNKPRYVMGVGYPEDLVVSVALGADMFDCVWPTRTAVSTLFSSFHTFSLSTYSTIIPFYHLI